MTTAEENNITTTNGNYEEHQEELDIYQGNEELEREFSGEEQSNFDVENDASSNFLYDQDQQSDGTPKNASFGLFKITLYFKLELYLHLFLF